MSPANRLVMPVDSFIHFAEQVAQLKDKLVRQGYSGSGVDGDAMKEEGDLGSKPKKSKSVH
jgi:hypothetical protein